MSPIGGPPMAWLETPIDVTLIYGSGETSEQAIERNKGLYVSGRISLRQLEFRVETILRDHPDERALR